MRKWILVGVIASASTWIGIGGTVQATSPIPDPHPNVALTADGLILDWHAPPPQSASHSDNTVSVTMPGYSQLDQPGAPQIPFAAVLIALPPDAAPMLDIVSIQEADLTLPGRLASAQRPAGVPHDGTFPTPREPIELTDIGILRGVRLARVTFYPARPINAGCGSPAADCLRITAHLRVSIAFHSAFGVHPSAVRDPLSSIVRSAVVNPDQIQPIQRSTIRPLASALGNPTSAIEVSSPGLTAITYEALAAIGSPVVATDPHNLHLTRAGVEIAAEWEGDADGVFEPGERLVFHAEPRFSRYTTTDVYFLSIQTTPGLRMTTRSAAPGGVPAGSAWLDAPAETNTLYTPDCLCPPIPPGRDGDRWTWDDLRRPDRAARSYPIQIPSLDATQPATLTVWLIGYTDVVTSPDHRVDVSLNTRPLGRVEWNGKQAITATLVIPPGIARDGANTVTLALPGLPGVAVEGTWLDAFSIDTARGQTATGSAAVFTGESLQRAYTLALASAAGVRAYDVTDADHPVRLTGIITQGSSVSLGDPPAGGRHRYLVTSTSGIQSPAKMRLSPPVSDTSADYVIIAPAIFTPALDSLAALRQSQGLTVTLEDTQAIYDAYGGGRPEPDAIRAFLAHAYDTWTPAPAEVLLVGDGTFDPKRYRATSPPTFIPPYLAGVDALMDETAADNRFVTVHGSDNLPDMAIGRLPVNTLAETQIVVDKIVRYETQPFPGGWNANAIFVADNIPDAAGDFPAQSDMIISRNITAPFTAQRIYFAPPTTTVTFTHQTILDRWNSGAGMILYTGHASVHQWAAERLFHLDDVASLNNGRMLPIVLEMTCFTASFHNPTFATLDESLLRRSNGGAVAAWGATGLGVSTGHAELADGFLRGMYTLKTDLGSAAISGKLSLVANQPAYRDLVDTFTLLGDPATRPSLAIVPWSHFTYLPLIQR